VTGLTVTGNVLYQIRGHGIFTETGTETNNIVHNNMVSNVIPSYGLQYTDQTPAGFFITNPDNDLQDNHAKCSKYYGFWYYLKASACCGAYNQYIVPYKTRLGIFKNNEAHGCGEHGLFIDSDAEAAHHPRTRSYEAIGAGNEAIQAYYENFKSWRNRGSGIETGALGAVIFKNCKMIDNYESALSIGRVVTTSGPGQGECAIEGGLIAGWSQGWTTYWST
jgi:hypothetical protein